MNNKPFEISFVVSTYLFGFGGDDSHCRDGMTNNPSCGLALDKDGAPVPDSQGFCCDCSFSDIIGASSNSDYRGAESCDILSTSLSSAHCLRLDDLWYDAYEIKPSTLESSVTAVVFQQNSDGSSPRSTAACQPYASIEATYNWTCIDVLNVGQTHPVAVSEDKQITVTYIGDLSLSTALHDLTNKYLFVPDPRVLPPALQFAHPQIVVC